MKGLIDARVRVPRDNARPSRRNPACARVWARPPGARVRPLRARTRALARAARTPRRAAPLISLRAPRANLRAPRALPGAQRLCLSGFLP